MKKCLNENIIDSLQCYPIHQRHIEPLAFNLHSNWNKNGFPFTSYLWRQSPIVFLLLFKAISHHMYSLLDDKISAELKLW